MCAGHPVSWFVPALATGEVLQTADEEKRAKADFVISTDKDINFTRIEVAELVHRLLDAQP